MMKQAKNAAACRLGIALASNRLTGWIGNLLMAAAMLVTSGLALADTHYVWRDNPNTPVPPYTNGWTSASTEIQLAVDAAADDDTVLVTNGTYDTGGASASAIYGAISTNRVCVNNRRLTIRSVNGAEHTIIKGAPDAGTGGNGPGAVRCVWFYAISADSSLSGFTLSNGYTRVDGHSAYDQSGGGIFITSSQGTISNCTISWNHAYRHGGGAFLNNSSTVLTNCTLTANATSAEHGGGVYINMNGTLNNCWLNSNTSTTTGGGAALSGGGNLNGCTLSNNYATTHGGGVSFNTPGGVLSNCTLIANQAATYGGGGYLAGGGTLVDCRLYTNKTTTAGTGCGGGVMFNLGGTLSRCTLSNNYANVGGGAYFNGNGTLNSSLVVANRSADSGAGLYFQTSSGNAANNCLLIGNVCNANHGGNALMKSGQMNNCTLVAGYSKQGAGYIGGVYLLSGTPSMTNCIAWGNTNFDVAVGAGSANYCCLSNNWAGGTGNIGTDPKFMNASAGDYRLSPSSPCVNKGVNIFWTPSSLDYEGQPRIRNGTVDMGAYELFIPSGTILSMR